MSRIGRYAGMALALALLAGACTPSEAPAPPFSLPDDWRRWRRPVEGLIDTPVPGHGMSIRRIYANPAAFSPRVTRSDGRVVRVELPEGATVVKQIFEDRAEVGQVPGRLFIMHKDPDHRMATFGWRFFIQKPDGPPTPVTSKACHGCHAAANEPHPYFDKNPSGVFRDCLFVPFYRPATPDPRPQDPSPDSLPL